MQTVAELSRTSALNVVPSRDNRLPAGNSFNSGSSDRSVGGLLI
jgi:hypothetical protein